MKIDGGGSELWRRGGRRSPSPAHGLYIDMYNRTSRDIQQVYSVKWYKNKRTEIVGLV